MATVYVTLFSAERVSVGSDQLVVQGDNARSETITSSGTSAAGSLVASGGEAVAKIACADQTVAVVAADTPVATLATGAVVLSGAPEYITIKTGQSIAVIDV